MNPMRVRPTWVSCSRVGKESETRVHTGPFCGTCQAGQRAVKAVVTMWTAPVSLGVLFGTQDRETTLLMDGRTITWWRPVPITGTGRGGHVDFELVRAKV